MEDKERKEGGKEEEGGKRDEVKTGETDEKGAKLEMIGRELRRG